MSCYSREHPRDIGECLKRLVNNSWLECSGHGRGTNYTLVHKEKPDLLSLLPSSEHSELSSEHSELSSEHYKRLKDIAAPVRGKGRTNKQLVENIIIKLCSEHYLPLRTLAELLRREPDSIRNHYVNDMLKRGLLELKYPEQKNYPQQAYKTVSSLKIQTQGVSETEN